MCLCLFLFCSFNYSHKAYSHNLFWLMQACSMSGWCSNKLWSRHSLFNTLLVAFPLLIITMSWLNCRIILSICIARKGCHGTFLWNELAFWCTFICLYNLVHLYSWETDSPRKHGLRTKIIEIDEQNGYFRRKPSRRLWLYVWMAIPVMDIYFYFSFICHCSVHFLQNYQFKISFERYQRSRKTWK